MNIIIYLSVITLMMSEKCTFRSLMIFNKIIQHCMYCLIEQTQQMSIILRGLRIVLFIFSIAINIIMLNEENIDHVVNIGTASRYGREVLNL